MEDKNKIKGWNSYSRKWWGPLVSTEIRILFLIEFAVVLIGAITGVIIWCSKGFEGFTTLSDGFEFARLFIAVMIAVGGAYGLILASRRSAKFSEQVDTGQKQLFNEQLGRGAELLANEGIVMRQTGIRVLGNLAERTINEPEQVKLIMQIIHDFVRSQIKHPSNDEGAEDKEAEDKGVRDKGDIEQLSIRTLGSLYNKLGQPNDLKELIDFSECYLVELNFTETELQGADFWRANLQGADFWRANLQEARFIAANLQNANFRDANLQGANFIGANLQETDLNGAKLQWVDCTFANFSNAENLEKNQIKGMIFHAKKQPTLPKGLEQFLDKKRGYEFKGDPDDKFNLRRFVKSDAEWSERVVHEWIREYLASIRSLEDAG